MSVESAFASFLERVAQGQRRVAITGLLGLGVAHAVWRVSRRKPVVFVTRSGALEETLRDLRFVAGANAHRVFALPADERTPYHATSPDPLIVMERMATLHKLGTGAPFDVLVITPEALCRRGVPFDEIQRMAELVRAPSPCAARSSTCSSPASTSRCASICSATPSRASRATTRRTSAPSAASATSPSARPAKSISTPPPCPAR
jgi:hypothetical protein